MYIPYFHLPLLYPEIRELRAKTCCSPLLLSHARTATSREKKKHRSEGRRRQKGSFFCHSSFSIRRRSPSGKGKPAVQFTPLFLLPPPPSPSIGFVCFSPSSFSLSSFFLPPLETKRGKAALLVPHPCFQHMHVLLLLLLFFPRQRTKTVWRRRKVEEFSF